MAGGGVIECDGQGGGKIFCGVLYAGYSEAKSASLFDHNAMECVISIGHDRLKSRQHYLFSHSFQAVEFLTHHRSAF